MSTKPFTPSLYPSPVLVISQSFKLLLDPRDKSFAHHSVRLRFNHSATVPWGAVLYQISFLTMLALHNKKGHSYSLDGRLDLSEHGHLTSSHMIRQQPTNAEDIWDSYFDGDGFVYEGPDLDLISDRVVQSDLRMPSNRDLDPSREHSFLDLTIGERPDVDFEDTFMKEHQLTERPTSNIALSNLVSKE